MRRDSLLQQALDGAAGFSLRGPITDHLSGPEADWGTTVITMFYFASTIVALVSDRKVLAAFSTGMYPEPEQVCATVTKLKELAAASGTHVDEIISDHDVLCNCNVICDTEENDCGDYGC